MLKGYCLDLDDEYLAFPKYSFYLDYTEKLRIILCCQAKQWRETFLYLKKVWCSTQTFQSFFEAL